MATQNATACAADEVGPDPLFTISVVSLALLSTAALAALGLCAVSLVRGRAAARLLIDDLRSRYAPLADAPRELYFVYAFKVLESYGYFSFSIILVLYLSDEFGQSDVQAGWLYGLFGGMTTVYGLMVGFLIDNLGVRRSLILGSLLLLVARSMAMLTSSINVMAAVLLFFMPLGTALGIPVLTTAIRRYTTDDNRAVAFGLFYAAMNVAALLSGPAADLLRGGFGCGATVLGVHLSAYRLLVLTNVIATLAQLAIAVLGVREIEVLGGTDGTGTVPFAPRRGSPWRIALEIGRTSRFWRFLLLVVLLVAVRLIFRHLDATFPKYLLRTHGPAVPYGLLCVTWSNPSAVSHRCIICGCRFRYAINPAMIIVLVPLVSAYTRHVPPLTMIKYGSAVSAASPFCLAVSSSVAAAVAFVALLSVGEACWSPRLYERVATI